MTCFIKWEDSTDISKASSRQFPAPPLTGSSFNPSKPHLPFILKWNGNSSYFIIVNALSFQFYYLNLCIPIIKKKNRISFIRGTFSEMLWIFKVSYHLLQISLACI